MENGESEQENEIRHYQTERIEDDSRKWAFTSSNFVVEVSY